MQPPIFWKMVAAALLAIGLMMSAGRSNSTQLSVYTYDFEKGTDGWELQPGVWSRTPLENGHALRGQGHGFARLTAHSGNVSVLRFRFRLENPQSSLHANVLESFAAGHTRYFVSFSAEGVGITRQLGASFRQLGMADAQVVPNVFHEAHVMVGGGTIDVFLDKEGVVGVDDANPPPGGISLESLDNSVVYVDDVEVKNRLRADASSPRTAPAHGAADGSGCRSVRRRDAHGQHHTGRQRRFHSFSRTLHREGGRDSPAGSRPSAY